LAGDSAPEQKSKARGQVRSHRGALAQTVSLAARN